MEKMETFNEYFVTKKLEFKGKIKYLIFVEQKYAD